MTNAKKVHEKLTEIYAELSTINWIGADEGWDLAIQAVKKYINKLIIESVKEEEA